MRLIVFAAVAVLTSGPAVAQVPDAAPVVAAERAFAADAPSMGIAGSFNKWSVPEAIVIAGGRAQRIGEVWCHDASAGTMPEELGTQWCREWLENEAIAAMQEIRKENADLGEYDEIGLEVVSDLL